MGSVFSFAASVQNEFFLCSKRKQCTAYWHLNIANLETFRLLEFRAPFCFIAYAVDKLISLIPLWFWGGSEWCLLFQMAQSIVRYTRGEFSLVWIPPKADPEARILVQVVYSGP